MSRKRSDIKVSDLHCHILPGIDDGAENIDISKELIEAEKKCGVNQIMFTPHFWADSMGYDSFFAEREEAYSQIKLICDAVGIETKTGSEVRMMPQLEEMDLTRFAMGDTGYLLLEWPFIMYPLWGDSIVKNLLSHGIRPVFAHVERFDYFLDYPERLDRYIESGCLCQANGGAVIHPQMQKRVLDMIRDGRIHILSSDTHNPDKRPPRLDEAFEIIAKHLGSGIEEKMTAVADDIYNGRDVHADAPGRKKLFGFL